VGGYCVPGDPVYLGHARTQHRESFRLVELAQDINKTHSAYVVSRLQDTLKTRHGKALEGARILVLGLAHKAGFDDSCQSPAVEVVAELERNGAVVHAVDPHVAEAIDAPQTLLPYQAYDAVVLLAAHNEIDLAQIADEAVYVLDAQGVMPDASHIERL
jgi:UDP-N-acetyl-D-glucosamine dehydrogenase